MSKTKPRTWGDFKAFAEAACLARTVTFTLSDTHGDPVWGARVVGIELSIRWPQTYRDISAADIWVNALFETGSSATFVVLGHVSPESLPLVVELLNIWIHQVAPPDLDDADLAERIAIARGSSARGAVGYSLNGLRVIEPTDPEGTKLIPLPVQLWQWPGPDGMWDCGCPYCTADPAGRVPAAWDTLAIGRTAQGKLTAWMVHAPEHHGKKKLREFGMERR